MNLKPVYTGLRVKRLPYFCWVKDLNEKYYGKGGIRTLGDREATPIFKIGAINHSATFPSG